MIKLVAFDWNGTILADTGAVLVADNFVLRHYGLPEKSLREIQDKFRMPIRDFWIAMGLDVKLFDEDPANVVHKWMEIYEPLEQKLRSRSGSKEVMIYLQKSGIKSIIFSNHIVSHIEKQLTRLKLRHLVAEILARGAGDNSHMVSKSKDLKLRDYVAKNSLRPDEVMVVGDTEEEIEIAQKYGYISVAITGGNVSTKRLRAMKPNYLIHNLKKIVTIISNGRTNKGN